MHVGERFGNPDQPYVIYVGVLGDICAAIGFVLTKVKVSPWQSCDENVLFKCMVAGFIRS